MYASMALALLVALVLVGGWCASADNVTEINAITPEQLWAMAEQAELEYQAYEARLNEYYGPMEEKEHTFKEAIKRPPEIVSDVFTCLCLAPAAVVLIGWLRIGAFNFARTPVSLYTLGFHAGFGAILILYAAFWYCLDILTTLKILAGIGLSTILCGNRMLSLMSEVQKSTRTIKEEDEKSTTSKKRQ